MANLEDYLKWRGDLTFKQSSFNEVDNLILSEFSYVEIKKKNFSKTETINTILERFLNTYTEKEMAKKFALSQNPYNFFNLLKDSKRFKDLKVSHYVNKLSKKEEKQFSTLIIHLKFNTAYVAFKGTDETLVGWKEDLNMGYMEEVPSQKEAVFYVNQIPFYLRHLYLGGHSKGGNLAVYASVKCKRRIQKRIKKVFNNDGPGFSEEFILSENYTALLPKIFSFQPETSIIGMLLTHKGDCKVIKSDSIGLWQHDPLTWQVLNTSFVTIKEVNETSNKINKTITNWLVQVDKKKREIFINTLFQVLEKNNISNIEQLMKLKIKYLPGFLKTFTKLDVETKNLVLETVKLLMLEARKNFDRKTILHGFKSLNKKRS